MISNSLKHYANAKKAIVQLNNGEWLPAYGPEFGRVLLARRDGLELWLGNGPWFCEIRGDYFGLFWRHYVWWKAARAFVIRSHRDFKRDVPTL